jgi:hypothetical protein
MESDAHDDHRYHRKERAWDFCGNPIAGNNPRSVNGKSWIGVKEVDLVRDAAKSLDAEASPSG